LGCGSGAVYRHMAWQAESFTAMDRSEQMLLRHPRGEYIDLVCEDFDRWQAQKSYELIVSSSALQWSNDIGSLIERMASACYEGAFAVFTDKTFKTLYTMSGRTPFLPRTDTLLALFQNYFTCKYEIKSFTQHFPDTLSLFRHIKRSGVSGGEKQLTLSQMRVLMREYPHTYLEFEVLFVWGVSKRSPFAREAQRG
jgi:malonyl-CoA O-methyltransferase